MVVFLAYWLEKPPSNFDGSFPEGKGRAGQGPGKAGHHFLTCGPLDQLQPPSSWLHWLQSIQLQPLCVCNCVEFFICVSCPTVCVAVSIRAEISEQAGCNQTSESQTPPGRNSESNHLTSKLVKGQELVRGVCKISWLPLPNLWSQSDRGSATMQANTHRNSDAIDGVCYNAGALYTGWCTMVQLMVHAWINVEGRWWAGAYHLDYFTTIIPQLWPSMICIDQGMVLSIVPYFTFLLHDKYHKKWIRVPLTTF